MPKLTGDGDDVIYRGEHLCIRAVRRSNGSLPAKEWFDELPAKLKSKVLSAADALEHSWRHNQPNSAKWDKMRGYDLWEFRATTRKSNPSLRLYGVRKGNTLWAALGVRKTGQKAKRSDIDKALRILSEGSR